MGDSSNDSAVEQRPIIYLTGFGPFPPHGVNPSQVAVEHLDVTKLEEELDVKVVKEIIPVEYEKVTKVVKQRWKELKPKLTVHVGVSGQAETLVLEQVGHNNGYSRLDNCRCLPSRGECCPGGEEVITSGIRMDLISRALNSDTSLKLTCVKSTDAGRFLCDFIFYTSLHEDKSRSAFIHVPTLNRFSKEDIASAIEKAVKEMYLQVNEHDRVEIEALNV
ncbi:pyroglutamyl-peptidase 1 [Macrobrachium rosenbergii]|uniref:pyroglutamyl-peptidase 1 n=1 Tax=Macrobrachium rosenbergii TaxID=79674 RepID=UPI0034D4B6F6